MCKFMAKNFADKMAEKRHSLVGKGEGSVRAAIIARIIHVKQRTGYPEVAGLILVRIEIFIVCSSFMRTSMILYI